MPIARSWQGLATRWLGSQGSIPAVRDLADVAFPVIVVGHDACDEGGMMGASCAFVPAAGQTVALSLTSSRGFVLWTLRFRSNAAAAGFALYASIRPSDPGFASPGLQVKTLRPLHDVNIVANAVAFPFVLAGSSMEFAIETPLVQNVVDFWRPVVVPPNEWLVIGNNINSNVQEYALLFEEGL